MTRIAVITTNDSTVIADMADLSGINLTGSRTDFICWEWDSPDPGDVTTVEALSEYKGTIPLS